MLNYLTHILLSSYLGLSGTEGLLIFVNSHITTTRITYTKTLKHFKQDLLSQSDAYKSTPLLRRHYFAVSRHISVFTKFVVVFSCN